VVRGVQKYLAVVSGELINGNLRSYNYKEMNYKQNSNLYNAWLRVHRDHLINMKRIVEEIAQCDSLPMEVFAPFIYQNSRRMSLSKILELENLSNDNLNTHIFKLNERE
jgi:hypothetical protein